MLIGNNYEWTAGRILNREHYEKRPFSLAKLAILFPKKAFLQAKKGHGGSEKGHGGSEKGHGGSK